MPEMTHQQKLDHYSAAMPKDIGTKTWQYVESSVLRKGFVGTVFKEPISTKKGWFFHTRQEAKANAEFFVAEVKKAKEKANG